MKTKEISKLLAVTVTATTILNPYMAYAETANKSQTEISVEANDTNKAENVGESLQQEEINTDTAVNSQIEDSNETTDNVADEVTEEAVNNEESGTVTDDSAVNATTESSEESAPSVSEGSLYLSQLDLIGNKSSVGYGSIVKDGNIEGDARLLTDNYFNLRLATSISLAYSRDVLVEFWIKRNKEINAVRRYEIYQDLISSGLIDKGGDTMLVNQVMPQQSLMDGIQKLTNMNGYYKTMLVVGLNQEMNILIEC